MSLSVRERAEGFPALAVAVAPQFPSERAEGFLPFAAAVSTPIQSLT
jgi:hypothetical protein